MEHDSKLERSLIKEGKQLVAAITAIYPNSVELGAFIIMDRLRDMLMDFKKSFSGSFEVRENTLVVAARELSKYVLRKFPWGCYKGADFLCMRPAVMFLLDKAWGSEFCEATDKAKRLWSNKLKLGIWLGKNSISNQQYLEIKKEGFMLEDLSHLNRKDLKKVLDDDHYAWYEPYFINVVFSDIEPSKFFKKYPEFADGGQYSVYFPPSSPWMKYVKL